MTRADEARVRRIELLTIVLGIVGVITVAVARPHMEQPRVHSSAARG